MTVTDGRGRRVADGGLARWLAAIAPVRLQGDVAVALVRDAHIRKLNRQYRGKDYATDVLSFATASVLPSPPPRSLRNLRASFLGDIANARGVARRQARDAGHAFRTELRILALHGLLHLMGYDHDKDRGEMARVEERLRRRAGLPAGLIGRVGRPRSRQA